MLGRAAAVRRREDAESDGQPVAPGMLAPRTTRRAPRSGSTPATSMLGEALLAFGLGARWRGVDAASVVMNLSERGDLAEAAANLFGYLRTLDSRNADAIAVMPIPEDGLGEAINDRLRRAAVGRE